MRARVLQKWGSYQSNEVSRHRQVQIPTQAPPGCHPHYSKCQTMQGEKRDTRIEYMCFIAQPQT